MTAPTVEQMLDELVSVSATWIATGRGQRVKDARLAILSYVSGLERERDEAYEKGWRVAAAWAHRPDLISDIDSPAYAEDREQALATIAHNEDEG